MELTLRIFVIEDCPNCVEARSIAADIERIYPHLRIEFIDVLDSQVAVPEAVFATPTFMLNDRVVSLGNPGPGEVARWLREAATPPL